MYAMSDDGLGALHDPTRTWFAATFGEPTQAQQMGWPAIAGGESCLLLAPTGSGKTLAAFLVAIDRLLFEPPPHPDHRCRVVYVSPLKALAVDVEKNLRRPLAGVARAAEALGVAHHAPQIAVRTGDTPARDRARFRSHPADILITTPESLFLMLTSTAREALRSVEWVIVDEIHAMVATKRGTHLSLTLERLEENIGRPLRRIGLSATVRPAEEVARFLGGQCGEPPAPRPVRLIDAGSVRRWDLAVVTPSDHTPGSAPLPEVVAARRKRKDRGEGPRVLSFWGEPTTGAWPTLQPMILDLIRAHKTTLVFVNNRRLAERLAIALNEIAGEVIAYAHHGSIAREKRLTIEHDLKSGRLPAIVCTSSLELGIDMGSIDLVVQVEAPPSVSAGLQRVGRAGHQVGASSKGIIIIPKFRDDLLASAAVAERMLAGDVEPMRYPRCPLDVLAQQIVAIAAMDDRHIDDLAALVRRAAPYADLPEASFLAVLDMLSGKYPSDAFAELRPRITWNRLSGLVTAREGARRLAVSNSGSIPDRGLFGVFMAGSEPGKGRVGELDEIMVYETRVNDVIVLGASSWRVEEIGPDKVTVTPAPGVPGRTPFWHGEGVGRPPELGRAIGSLSRRLLEGTQAEGEALLTGSHALGREAGRELISYLRSQVSAAGAAPDDRTILIERCKDENDDWRVCLLSPLGARILAPWAMAVAATIHDATGLEPDILWTDNGIVVRLPNSEAPPDASWFTPEPHSVEALVMRQLSVGGGGARAAVQGAPVNALFASRFREAAQRALLLPHGKIGERTPLWRQRKRAADLLHVAGRHPSFPIVMEAFRECMADFFDMPALHETLERLEDGSMRAVVADTRSPSPMAASLLFSYVGNFMYEGDAPIAERRAQALTIDPVQLKQLMGDAALRELISPEALHALEEGLQRLAPGYGARHIDGLHDLLLRLGDLTDAEAAVRCDPPEAAPGWLAKLRAEQRVLQLQVAGEPRWVAVEDASRYRDALGVELPADLHEAFALPVPDPLDDLLSRYARTHGPFTAADAAARFGLGPAVAEGALRTLEAHGRLISGAFRPGRRGLEWCEADVLRSLRGRSLAKLRMEVEPVSGAALTRYLLAHHGVEPLVGDAERGASGVTATQRDLLEAIRLLEGAPIAVAALETSVLPARVRGYDPRDLDLLTATGQVVWQGDGGAGAQDGRMRLYLADDAPLLARSVPSDRTDPLERAVVQALQSRGASFTLQLATDVGQPPAAVTEAVWRLVWAGVVTNDTLAPVRGLVSPATASRRSRPMVRPRHVPIVLGGLPWLARPTEAPGRWSVLAWPETSPAVRAAAQVEMLLARHGVLMREAVTPDEVEGGYPAAYGVMRAMEDAGRARRGYFVAGLAGAQFAQTGSADALRRFRDPGAEPVGHLLASLDPANPYGATLPWPDRPDGRKPARMANTWLALLDGCPAAWLGRGGHTLLLYPTEADWRDHREWADTVAGALAAAVQLGRLPSLTIREADGISLVRESEEGGPVELPPHVARLAEALDRAGFRRTGKGWFMRA
jgi:ATP-dependent Lhr-like helicase